jgi:hypothetical protein
MEQHMDVANALGLEPSTSVAPAMLGKIRV